MEHQYFLNIARWAAFSPQIADAQQWQAWATGNLSTIPAPTCTADLPQVPAMLRRRLSPLGRAALWTLYQISEAAADTERPPLATIFCSRHGEVARTVTLLQELAAQQPLSPAAFSLSVHNAVGGIYSIASGVTGHITALSAGPDSLCAALLEAWSMLQDGDDDDRIHCVIYDDDLPPPYRQATDDSSQVQALAFEVRRPSDSGILLSFSLESNPQQVRTASINDQFLRFLLDGERQQLQLGADQRLWHWQKPPSH